MKKILLTAALLAAASQSHAGADTPERRQALDVLIRHAATVACDTTLEGREPSAELLENVHAVERGETIGSATYFILWGGDMGCNRGSGTSSYFVSEVGRYSDSRPFMVRSNHAFGEVLGQVVNPRFIRKLEKTRDGRFVIVSSEHAENDPNNFPSDSYRYTLEMRDGRWQVVDREFLGKNE
ncbi:MAG: hypothetical protein QM674_12560 [Burkholderiaceae bacterium]